jgi:putative hydrolase of the HAD superfamily
MGPDSTIGYEGTTGRQDEQMKSPKRCIRAILFDMDNTLFDFTSAKHAACRSVAGYLGRDDPLALYEYFKRPVHGYESHEHIRDFLVDHSGYGEEVFQKCCRLYEEEKLRSVSPFPGMPDTLEALLRKNLTLGVVTDAHAHHARSRLGKTGLLDYFPIVVTTEMTGQKKPSPAPFLLALSLLGSGAGETLLVGDSLRREIEPGIRLGMITAHAAYGDPGPSDYCTCTPDYVLTKVKDILAIAEVRSLPDR